MLNSILLILAVIPLVAGSLFHAVAFMLAVAALVNLVSRVRRGMETGFPGTPLARHAKLAVPALAVLAADAALLWLAAGHSLA
ncbi:hypothetical protein [Desulfovibrio ferrophilus]|uniref:Uncharacterized protein n=1 Tax=Desulfovibrio ferrophilus TaxID=241368 RepID=A0A2Z6AVW7_9BACT|nr:hypothetical protein [Desulfovibrio ferrophilus]BBD07384.1 uncharacterized protein DFE_0658 [Desulfovibrio ferrophilus]